MCAVALISSAVSGHANAWSGSHSAWLCGTASTLRCATTDGALVCCRIGESDI